MKKHRVTKWAVALAASAVIIAATLVNSPHVQAQNEREDHDSRVAIGFQIAPVPLNLEGKDRALVGLGSYWVNAVASCDDCHSAGPQTQFAPEEIPTSANPRR